MLREIVWTYLGIPICSIACLEVNSNYSSILDSIETSKVQTTLKPKFSNLKSVEFPEDSRSLDLLQKFLMFLQKITATDTDAEDRRGDLWHGLGRSTDEFASLIIALRKFIRLLEKFILNSS